ncbi:BON domain-containing protein [Aestuariicella hydrocarbonica]|uniref:BON domain-containing protein n=1 Tax=Pseudomaricurvus hydrocarbonicus TaxID=1470433 RepID=A0A9E5MIS9_9GAMM|nr:BON domain-containing protein [Aestuariicella hydrocarbonica]NHO63969.1 BON domain-containing protein [Aestuariicella hydrocarbonica]
MNKCKKSRKLALASAISLVMVVSAGTLAAPKLAEDITEARQESQIWTTYALNRHLDAHDIKVTVDHGLATLTGKVNEDISKELAQQIALGVRGIKDVDNGIEVEADAIPSSSWSGRSYAQVVEDASISAAVKSKLLWSKHAQGLSANVETQSGKVTLLGTANSSAAKEMAGLLATKTHGVEAVKNKLVVEEGKSTMTETAKETASEMGQGISDTWITTKVKSTLMYSSNVEGSAISVTSRNGVVTLTGKVASGAEHDLVVALANNVRGVSEVDASGLKPS